MLGILGGMGPLASAVFYEMLIEQTGAETDQENMNFMLYNHADMPDRTAVILSGAKPAMDDIRSRLMQDITLLADAGCTAVACTCNTAHYFIDEMEKDLPIPVINLPNGAVLEAARRFPGGKVAVLATDGTNETGLFNNYLAAQGMQAVLPKPECQAKVMSVIYDYVKKALPVPADLWQEIDSEVRELGCDCAILGCTELSVLARDAGLDLSESGFYIDAMDVLAKTCVSMFGNR